MWMMKEERGKINPEHWKTIERTKRDWEKSGDQNNHKPFKP